MDIELSFCELRCKEVINIIDGRRLGRIVDIVMDARTGKVTGFFTPGCRRLLFRASDDIFVPWCDIDKIGDDVILVKLGKHCPHCGGRGCDKCRGGGGDRCPHCGGRGCDRCRGGDRCPHCGGRGCDKCRGGDRCCPHCGGRGCDRCCFCNDARRFTADWVCRRFKHNCNICGGAGCASCAIEENEPRERGTEKRAREPKGEVRINYNRYDDRTPQWEDDTY